MSIIIGKGPICPDCGHLSHARPCRFRTDMSYRTYSGHLVEQGVFCHCNYRRHSPVRNRRVVLMTAALLLAAVAIVVFGGRAKAATLPVAATVAIGVPGVDTCPKDAPLPELPDSGAPGIFVEVPDATFAPVPDQTQDIPNPVDTSVLFGTSGMGGMLPFTYDQGCNFLDASSHLSAWTDREFSSYPVVFGQSMTALGDAIDRRAWKPSWIQTLLGDLSRRAADAIEIKILVPFLGLGLILATLLGLRQAARGDTRRVAQAVAWALTVLVIGAFFLWAPTKAATLTQSGTSVVVGSLYTAGNAERNDMSPSQASTEEIVQAIHYNGWLRRTFGTDRGDTATYWGPRLLAATRITWQENYETDPSWEGYATDAERSAARDRRVQLIKDKQAQFTNVTAEIKKDDPIAYQWVKGGQGTVTQAWFEFGFAFFASGLRIAADLLLMLAMILLVGVGIVWLVTMAFLVTPIGEGLGRGLLNSAARGVGYALEAGVAAWLWSLYSGVVLAPGESSWWAFVLLGAGAFIFWTVLRPDRKALALLTQGRVRGNGRWTRWAFGRILTGVGAGWAAGRVAAKTEREQWAQMGERDRDARAAARPVGWTEQDEADAASYRERYMSGPVGAERDAQGRINTAYAPIPAPAPVMAPAPATVPHWDAQPALDAIPRVPPGPTPPPPGTTEMPDRFSGSVLDRPYDPYVTPPPTGKKKKS